MGRTILQNGPAFGKAHQPPSRWCRSRSSPTGLPTPRSSRRSARRAPRSVCAPPTTRRARGGPARCRTRSAASRKSSGGPARLTSMGPGVGAGALCGVPCAFRPARPSRPFPARAIPAADQNNDDEAPRARHPRRGDLGGRRGRRRGGGDDECRPQNAREEVQPEEEHLVLPCAAPHPTPRRAARHPPRSEIYHADGPAPSGR